MNQFITSFFNMASLNVNNHIKSSLEVVHRGTVPEIFWPILEPETVSKPQHSCVQQNKPLFPIKTTHRSQKSSSLMKIT